MRVTPTTPLAGASEADRVRKPTDAEILAEIAAEEAARKASLPRAVDPIPVRGRSYLMECEHCGWVGSSELCGTDHGPWGDSDIYCPACDEVSLGDPPSEADAAKFGQALFDRIASLLADREALRTDRDERTAICSALGCIDKPGVPLKFVQDLQRRLSESYARNDELIRTWDRATPTERQELDRMRRGWGPSSPTERVRRKTDVAACVQVLGSALTELSVPEEDADDVPEEAQAYLDAAYDRVEKAYKAAIAVSHAIQDEPDEWPDIKAAEERGALAAEARVAQLEAERSAAAYLIDRLQACHAGKRVRDLDEATSAYETACKALAQEADHG